MSRSRESQQSSDEVADSISRGIGAIHHESYGSVVTRAETYLLPDLVLTVLDIELVPAERTLMAAGRGETVQQVRHEYEVAIRANFTAVVERATGRRVTAFASHTNLEPPFVSELFRLEPRRPASGAPR